METAFPSPGSLLLPVFFALSKKTDADVIRITSQCNGNFTGMKFPLHCDEIRSRFPSSANILNINLIQIKYKNPAPVHTYCIIFPLGTDNERGCYRVGTGYFQLQTQGIMEFDNATYPGRTTPMPNALREIGPNYNRGCGKKEIILSALYESITNRILQKR